MQEFVDGNICISWNQECRGFNLFDSDEGEGVSLMKLSTARKFAQWVLATYPPPKTSPNAKKY